jgi:hypothetical protein
MYLPLIYVSYFNVYNSGFAVKLGFCKSGQTAVITSGQIIGFLEGEYITLCGNCTKLIRDKTGTTTKMQIIQIP